jgi:hypothetical protein
MSSEQTRKRRVKFSKKDELQYIEPRGKSPVRPSNPHDPMIIDDEVKDHPIFASSSPKPLLTPIGYAQKIQKQIEDDPNVKTITNPISNRTITRFGNSYWTLISDVFGRKSKFYSQEKSMYKKLFNKN